MEPEKALTQEEQDAKDENDLIAWIEEGKKKFGCDVQIEQTAVLVNMAKDSSGNAIVGTAMKCTIQIRKVHPPKVEVPAPGNVLDFKRAQNGG